MKLVPLALALTSTLVSTAYGQDERPQNKSHDIALASPYFIDEIHCEGLNTVQITDLPFVSADDEANEIQKNVDYDTCKKIFAHFEIKKFDWITPGDLERLEIQLKSSGYFKQVELSIKKSELKNHVHLFAKFTALPRFHFSASNDIQGSKGRGSSISRVTDHFNVQVTDRKLSPTQTVTYQAKGIFDKSTIDTDVPRSGGLPNNANSAVNNRNFTGYSLGFKSTGLLSHSLILSTDFTFFGSHLKRTADSVGTVGSIVGMGLTHRDTLYGTFGSFSLTPKVSYAYFRKSPYSLQNRQDLFMPGINVNYIYGQEDGNHSKADINYAYSNMKNSILNYELEHRRGFDNAVPFYYFKIGLEDVRNPFLPEHMVIGENYSKTWLGAGVGTSFTGFQKLHSLTAELGTENLTIESLVVTPEREKKYSQGSVTLGLGYTLKGETLNVRLGAKLAGNRNY